MSSLVTWDQRAMSGLKYVDPYNILGNLTLFLKNNEKIISGPVADDYLKYHNGHGERS